MRSHTQCWEYSIVAAFHAVRALVFAARALLSAAKLVVRTSRRIRVLEAVSSWTNRRPQCSQGQPWRRRCGASLSWLSYLSRAYAWCHGL